MLIAAVRLSATASRHHPMRSAARSGTAGAVRPTVLRPPARVGSQCSLSRWLFRHARLDEAELLEVAVQQMQQPDRERRVRVEQFAHEVAACAVHCSSQGSRPRLAAANRQCSEKRENRFFRFGSGTALVRSGPARGPARARGEHYSGPFLSTLNAMRNWHSTSRFISHSCAASGRQAQLTPHAVAQRNTAAARLRRSAFRASVCVTTEECTMHCGAAASARRRKMVLEGARMFITAAMLCVASCNRACCMLHIVVL